MDILNTIRENVFYQLIAVAFVTSFIIAFLNALFEKMQNIENTKLSIMGAFIFTVLLTKFTGLDYHSFETYQDLFIKIIGIPIVSYLVAKVKGQDLVDSAIAKITDTAKGMIQKGNKDASSPGA